MPIKIEPSAPHPVAENTLTLSPVLSVPPSDFVSSVLVEIKNSPLTVSGAKTIFQIGSPSFVPSEYTLSTTAEA